MIDRIRSLSQEISRDITDWRREFHTYPELSFREIETTARIKARLEEMGFTEMRVGLKGVPTGLIADLGSGKQGPCFALRADIDALPIREKSRLPYCSVNDGVMHACGHDAHVAILLGAARILKELEAELPGRVRFIFQPSEESPLQSGAQAMIENGALERVDAIAGLHIWGTLPAGKVGLHAGPFMAASDEWEITIRGKGGHGGVPHLATDPIVAAGALLGSLQTLVSRETDPLESAVVSCCRIAAGTSVNIIPDSASLEGIVRTFNPSVRAAMQGRMARLCSGICEAMGCRAEIDYKNVLPATINDPILTERATKVARNVLGADKVMDIPPSMGSEDMSYYLQKVPGVFLFLGTENGEKGIGRPQHHPEFDVDDDVLPAGSSLLAALAWNFLKQKTTR